jgi:hypothetical protein
MMLYPLLRACALLLLVIAFVLSASVAAVYGENDALRQFLSETAACGQPCVMGIALYDADRDRVQAVLRSHPWVTKVEMHPAADGRILAVTWQWSGRQPAFIDADRAGVISFNYGNPHINSITVHLALEMGEVWRTIGAPEKVSMFGALNGEMLYLGSYREPSLYVTGVGQCPASADGFWHMPVDYLMWVNPYKPADELYDAADPYEAASCRPLMMNGDPDT